MAKRLVRKSKKLTEAMKKDIVRLAHQGYTQKRIQEELQCSQWAVAHYAKGINPPRRYSDEVRQEIIRMLVQTDMSQRQIASIVGVTSRSVSYISKRLGLRPPRKNAKEFALNRQKPYRDKTAQLYEVFIFNVKDDPGSEHSIMLDHVPTYWDLIKACKETGLDTAEDFETEASSSIRDKLSFGIVYNRQMHRIATYSIERVKGDETDLDGFYDGMDRDYYD